MSRPQTCSVVLPAFNSADVIAATLAALYAQAIPPGWQCECVIVDDGSRDATRRRAEDLSAPSHWSTRILTGPHRGASHARNRGVTATRGRIILFLGADILLRPGAIAAHLYFHEQHPDTAAAALGFVVWDPRLAPTPLMEWMTHGGPQNDYDALLDEQPADPAHYWYGSHLSCKRDLLPPVPFNENFTQYGWEDLDLGRRIRAGGASLYPLTAARSLHHHAYTAAAIVRRQRLAGRGLVTYQTHHSQAALLPRRTPRQRWQHRTARILRLDAVSRLLLTLIGQRWSAPRLFRFLTAVPFWVGVEEARLSSLAAQPESTW